MTETRKIKPTDSGECDFSEDESYADLNQSPNCNTLNIWGYKKEETQKDKNSARACGGKYTYVVSWKYLQPMGDSNI